MKHLPKKIWLFWYQGFFDAPSLVKKCIISWQFHHPNYKIYILDQHTIHQYINIPSFINIKRNDISYQKYANYIRLALLKKYGGIWIDPNIYCFEPLDSWLHQQMSSGIFLFENSADDRLIANWFISAEPNHYIINQWLNLYTDFFKREYFTRYPESVQSKLKQGLSKVLNKKINTTTYWFSYFVRDLLKIYPYLVMHYMFNLLYLKDDKFKELWDSSSKLSAYNFDIRCHQVDNYSIKNIIEAKQKHKFYLYKLAHEINKENKHYKPYMAIINNDFETILKNAKEDSDL